MASTGPWRRLARVRRACVLAALAASVTGCVGMPNSGSPGTFGATPQDTTPDSDFIGALPAGPAANWTPTEIVTGFLNASASYPVYSAVAREYLVGTASKAWDPNWSVQVVDQVNVPLSADYGPAGRQATVDVTGTVRASFNGSGQYVGAQQNHGGALTTDWPFKLVKVNGQWRITNPPKFRMLTEPDFSQVYKPQDLYFFDSTGQVLVPDSVFVPAGTSPTALVSNLVGALLKNPQTPWLQNGTNPTPPAAVTAFPRGTTMSPVAVDGTTATINLGGAAASATPTAREQIAAQLVWTLTGPQAGQQTGPPNIQAIQLEINGKPWTPQTPPCPGVSGQSPAQKLAMYSCKNPYPLATSSAFYYVGNRQAWSRCASESQVNTGFIGSALPVFGRTRVSALGPACGSPVQASSSPAVPPAQPHGVPPLSMVAVSPDGKYAAGVSADGRAVDVWAAGASKPSSTLATSGVTAIGWDRRDYLWVTQKDDTTTLVVQTNNNSDHGQITNSFQGKITGLSIAPDGVRVAAIVQTQSGPQLQLAAIGSVSPAPGQPGSPFVRTSIGPTVQLGPNVLRPIALTWYDADDLLVLAGAGSQTTLWEVPVDGQPAAKLPGALPGAISITANSAQNALVVGLTGNRMEVSASLVGPWQPLGGGGQNPAFPIPVVPVAASS
jgi:hypothetical protein